MSINAIISILILTVFGIFALTNANETIDHTANWRNLCQELKKNGLSNSSLNITFSDKPEIDFYIHRWSLNWNGINVPLPPVDFHEVYVKMGYQNNYEVIMTSKNGFLVHAIVFENKPYSDVYEKFKDANDSNSDETEDTIKNNNEKKAFRTSDVILMGYQITPGDLNCLEKHQTEEAAKAAALLMKGIERPGELISVFKNVGIYKGWIEKERYPDYMGYVVNIIQDDNLDVLYQINYRIPNNSGYHDLPFLIGNDRQKSIPQSPDWLLALSSAFTAKSKDFWERYAALARKAGISEKSIIRVMKNQNVGF